MIAMVIVLWIPIAAGVCGGDAVEDECGGMCGDGIADGACDWMATLIRRCGCGEAAGGKFDCDGNCIVIPIAQAYAGGDAVER